MAAVTTAVFRCKHDARSRTSSVDGMVGEGGVALERRQQSLEQLRGHEKLNVRLLDHVASRAAPADVRIIGASGVHSWLAAPNGHHRSAKPNDST